MVTLLLWLSHLLQSLSRFLEYRNDSAYGFIDGHLHMVRVERKERCKGRRPAIISEDSVVGVNDIGGYCGERGENYYRGAI